MLFVTSTCFGMTFSYEIDKLKHDYRLQILERLIAGLQNMRTACSRIVLVITTLTVYCFSHKYHLGKANTTG